MKIRGHGTVSACQTASSYTIDLNLDFVHLSGDSHAQ